MFVNEHKASRSISQRSRKHSIILSSTVKWSTGQLTLDHVDTWLSPNLSQSHTHQNEVAACSIWKEKWVPSQMVFNRLHFPFAPPKGVHVQGIMPSLLCAMASLHWKVMCLTHLGRLRWRALVFSTDLHKDLRVWNCTLSNFIILLSGWQGHSSGMNWEHGFLLMIFLTMLRNFCSVAFLFKHILMSGSAT